MGCCLTGKIGKFIVVGVSVVKSGGSNWGWGVLVVYFLKSLPKGTVVVAAGHLKSLPTGTVVVQELDGCHLGTDGSGEYFLKSLPKGTVVVAAAHLKSLPKGTVVPGDGLRRLDSNWGWGVLVVYFLKSLPKGTVVVAAGHLKSLPTGTVVVQELDGCHLGTDGSGEYFLKSLPKGTVVVAAAHLKSLPKGTVVPGDGLRRLDDRLAGCLSAYSPVLAC